MPGLSAAEISRVLREIGDRMVLMGGNPHRARAYRRAAENLALSTIPLDQLIAEGKLTEIPGIGNALAAVITELHQTRKHPRLEAMRADIPEGVLDMLRIPGLRPDRIKKLFRELGIASVDQLEEAARTGHLRSMKGFGPAFQAKVLQGINMSRRPQGRHIHRATSSFSYASAELKRTHPNLTLITPAGELRRGCELVSTLELVALDPHRKGENETIGTAEGLRVYITSKERHGITLLLATGSDKHIEALRALAGSKGWTLDADGLHGRKGVFARKTEEEIYDHLGLPFIAPELRESGAEVELARDGLLPQLVRGEDIRGILHAHTTESDGADTLEDMAQASRSRGYAYLGLTDHSQSAHYAGGLKQDEVLAQQRLVDKLNERTGRGFRVFKGIESDILADGSLDYPEDILNGFDMVIASVHSRFRMNRTEQTERIIRAVANPHTTILGHVTGRLLTRRPGYDVDIEKILRACAENGVAVEINANPWRLDLDWRWCERGLELGCMFSINPDAHSTDEIDNIKWGVMMARKGAVPKGRVLNALSLSAFEAHLQQRQARRSSRSTRQRGRRRRSGIA